MWIKPQGYAEITGPDRQVVDLDHIRKEEIGAGTHRMDTCTCFHCGSVFHVSARMRPEDIGGLCKTCMHPICPKCVDKPCTPLEKQFDELEAALNRQRAVSEYGR